MERKEAEQRQIIIYWWNFGKKTLDFKGMVKDFLLEKGIKVRKIKEDSYKIDYGCGTSRFTIRSRSLDIVDVFDTAIKSLLTYLGDKTLYYSPYGKEYRINWR